MNLFLIHKLIGLPFRKFAILNAFKSGPKDYLYSPLELFSNKTLSTVVINVPISRVRAWGGGCLTADINPFLSDMTDLKLYGEFSTPSKLEVLHDAICEYDAAQVMGLDNSEAGFFKGKPNYFAAFPWDSVLSNADIERNRVKTLNNELSKYHPLADLLVDSKFRVRAELLRIKNLWDSLLKNGLVSTLTRKSPIVGQLLSDVDNNWAVLIRHGEHRIACLVAMGYLEVEIVLKRDLIIHGLDHDSWPHVMKKNISSVAAYKLFKRVIDGSDNPPRVNCVGYFL